MILSSLMFILLWIGLLDDVRRREVHPYITGAIAALSIIMIYSGPNTPLAVYLFHFMAAAGMFAAYKLKTFGGADIKAGIPLIFTMSVLQLYIFMIVAVCVHGYLYFKAEKPAPYFVAMAAGYYALFLFGVI